MKGSETGTCLPSAESSRTGGMAEEAGSNRGWNGSSGPWFSKWGPQTSSTASSGTCQTHMFAPLRHRVLASETLGGPCGLSPSAPEGIWVLAQDQEPLLRVFKVTGRTGSYSGSATAESGAQK